MTKEIKKRVNHLKNEKLAKEADEWNEYANKKQTEDLISNQIIAPSPDTNLKVEDVTRL